MTEKQVAKEFFEAHLPADLRDVVDLNYLELQPGSYIDDMQQESATDIVYKTSIEGHISYLFLNIEHQSRHDALMPFRMLKYTCNIIDQHLKQSECKKIPLVIPWVVYHGKEPWSSSTNIDDLVDAPKALVDAYFLKPFSLIDLNKIEDAILKERAWSGIMELTLKHIFAKDIQPYLADIMALMKRIGDEGQIFTEAILIYILNKAEIKDQKTFFNLIKTQLSEETGEKIMTIAEQLRSEGMQQGMQQGIQQVAYKMLLEGQDIAFVAKVTELSIEEVKNIREK